MLNQTALDDTFAHLPEALLERARAIKLVALDVDGTLTDGRLTFTSNQVETKAFHAHDGLGIKLLQAAGITVALISKRHSDIIHRRGAELGIEHIYGGKAEKLDVLQGVWDDTGIAPEHTAFMGDDWPDLRAMQAVHLAIAPANAHFAVKAHCQLVTRQSGGFGAVREAADAILYAQDAFEAVLRPFLINTAPEHG